MMFTALAALAPLCPDCPPVRPARAWALDYLLAGTCLAVLPFAAAAVVIALAARWITRREARS